MPTQVLHPFSKTAETFIAVDLGKIVYTSQEHGLAPLLEFIRKFPKADELVVFDNVVGRAAATLFTLVKPKVVYGLVGSQSAVAILAKAGVTSHFTEVVEQLRTTTEAEDYEMLAQGREAKELLAVLRGAPAPKPVKKSRSRRVSAIAKKLRPTVKKRV
ncbi:MAG: DUF1893 domain-containing protein [Candidatus Kerfeldbacteria bacterium]|nr:DUF1893 domain-containing protein [Candidatus Kerfeldbacteria bacterium]